MGVPPLTNTYFATSNCKRCRHDNRAPATQGTPRGVNAQWHRGWRYLKLPILAEINCKPPTDYLGDVLVGQRVQAWITYMGPVFNNTPDTYNWTVAGDIT